MAIVRGGLLPCDMSNLASLSATPIDSDYATYIDATSRFHYFHFFGQFSVTPSGLISGTATRIEVDGDDLNSFMDFAIEGPAIPISLLAPAGVFGPHITALLMGADQLIGTASADRLLGFSGNDTFFGGGGNDTYDGGNDSDTVSYASASALVHCILSDITFNRGDAAGDSYTSIENVIGSAFNDVLYGSNSANRLSGGGGNDLLVGQSAGDVLDGGAGTDTASYDASPLNNGLRADLLNPSTNTGHAAGDIYISIENLDGSSYNDILLGDNNANVLQGNTYHEPTAVDQDQLFGRGGNDVLKGWAGNDILAGGLGRDVLIGGAGADTFRFAAAADSGKTASTRDVITDFTHNATLALSDRIDLSLIDANSVAAGNQAFTFLAAKGAAFTGAKGQIHWFQIDSANNALDKTIIEGDRNGDKIADFQIELTGLKSLVAADFIL